MFFKQWDSDKYQNLGLILYNNYVQALEILDTEQAALDEAMVSLQISEADQVVAYVELLQKLAAAE